MGPISALVVLILGIFVPFVVIVAFPLRALYLIVFAERFVKVVSLILLLPWGYFLVDILRFGYVSVRDRPGMPGSTGPTVDPRVWLALGAAWLILEIMNHALPDADAALQQGVEDRDA
jgi:hypothetical protein